MTLSVEVNAQIDCNCTFSDSVVVSELMDSEQYDSVLNVIEKLHANPNVICISRYYGYKGRVAFQKREYDSSLVLYKQERDLILSYCDSSKIVSNLINNAESRYRQSKLDEAISEMLLALSLAERYNDTSNIIVSYSFLSLLFNKLLQTEKALHYCRLLLPYIEQMEYSGEKADLYNKLSSRYLHAFQDTKNQKYFDTCQDYTLKAHATALEFKDRYVLVRTYNKLQGIEYYKKNYKKALIYLDSAKRICQPGVDDEILYTINGDIGHIYLELAQYTVTKSYADSCLYYARKIGSYGGVMNAYALMYQCGSRSKDYKMALDALGKYYEIKDSVETIDKTKAVNELEEKYNRAKNERTIHELNQEKEISNLKIKYLTGGILSAILIIVAIFMYYRQEILKKKNEYLEVEQRLNRARLNPHLFFNSLTAIQGHALREKDIASVATYLSKQAKIMRITLESTYKELVSIEDEVDFLKQYLDTQMLLYKDRFDYEISIDEDIDISDMALPSMILQPFIENSIEHGFSDIDYKGKIVVSFKLNEQGLEVVVGDNGKGFAGKSNDAKFPSRATQIIKDRLFLLNQQYKSKAFYKLGSSDDAQGTVVVIQLPMIYVNESTDNR
ncbi:MAG: histidine kinase [Chitinophagales bacterium]|nr:histidine kinase [Chitinophagales bacterium]